MLKSNCTSESMVTALTPIKTYRKYFIKIKKKQKTVLISNSGYTILIFCLERKFRSIFEKILF